MKLVFLMNEVCGKAYTFWVCIQVISRVWAHPGVNIHSELSFCVRLSKKLDICIAKRETYCRVIWCSQFSATAAILNLQYKANYRVQWIRDHYGSKRNCIRIIMVLFVLNRWHIKISNWKTDVKWLPAMKFSWNPNVMPVIFFFFPQL